MTALRSSYRPDAGSAPCRVLLVDDSAVMRSVLQALLDGEDDFRIVHKASDATGALAFLAETAVDIVLLDHEMPGRKGLDALPDILRAAPGARVVLLSSHCADGNRTAVAALALGASEAVAKPSGGRSFADFGSMLLRRLRRLTAEDRRPAERPPMVVHRAYPAGATPLCLGIGASTGGIQALQAFFTGLGGGLGLPILVTQHLPAAFIPHYRVQVARMSGLPATVAVPGMTLRPDHIYIAPGNRSLGCVREGATVRLELVPGRDPVTQAQPSVNIMFAALARVFGAGALAVVLTGMGRDGTAGAGRIVDAGGAVLAQDPGSSVVWGMPGSVARAGLACATLRPEAMAGFVRRAMRGGA